MRPLALPSLLLLLPGLFLLPGCIPYSSFQAAPIMDPGTQSVSACISRSSFQDGNGEAASNEYTVLSQVGSRSPHFDYGFKGSGLFLDRDFLSVAMGGYVRSAVIANYLTVQLPCTWLLAEGSHYDFYVNPTVVASWPLDPRLELNTSASSYFGVEGSSSPYSYSIGLAIGSRAGSFRLRPEIAWLRSYGDDGNYRQFGLALEFHEEDRGREEGDRDDSIFSPD